jgi:hypothetical protein
MKTVVALYANETKAYDAMRDLVDEGFSREDLSIVARESAGEYAERVEDPALTDIAERDEREEGPDASGAGTGAAIGALAGLAVGIGVLVIPGIGPVIAAGPIATVLAGAGVGAVVGGLVGALTDTGVPREHAEAYADAIRRGGTLLLVRASDERVTIASDIMYRYAPIDMDTRASELQHKDWTGVDERSDPFTRGAVEQEQSRIDEPVTADQHPGVWEHGLEPPAGDEPERRSVRVYDEQRPRS